MTKLLRILKLIVSRLFVVALAVIAQVVLIVYFMIQLTSSYIYFQIISSIIGLLVFIMVVNQRMHPEQKIIWAFLIIVFPMVGIVLYSVFYINRPSKKHIEKYTKFHYQGLESEESYKQEIYKIANQYQDQVKYIENMSSLNAYKNTQCKYLKDGKEFYESLIKDLKNAKQFIFMEYFIINHGVMWNTILDVLKEKVKEGVEVKFIYDDLGSAKYVRGNYYKKLRGYGIQCYKYNKMIPLVSSYHNNRDHRKITVIDGYIGYTGGINLSDEYMNLTHPYGHWKDNAVRLYGPAVNNLTILFLQNFALASLKTQDYNRYLCDNQKFPKISNNEIIFPYGSGPKSRYYENFATDVFLNLIQQAKRSIDISTPYLIIDYATTNALIAAAARGVKVRILIPSKPDKKLIYAFSKQTAYELATYGIEIYTYTPGFNHAKSFLVDDEVAFIGTTNLDFRSLMHHYECGVWIYNSPCLKKIDQNFENDYLKSKLMSANDLKSKFAVKIIISFLKIFQSLL